MEGKSYPALNSLLDKIYLYFYRHRIEEEKKNLLHCICYKFDIKTRLIIQIQLDTSFKNITNTQAFQINSIQDSNKLISIAWCTLYKIC